MNPYVVIAIVVFLLFDALVLFVVTRPGTFRVERSADIHAPASVVFGIINDFHQWHRWSPWEKLDPNMTKTFSGPATGVGSSLAWSGNKKAGEGRNTILESTPDQRILMKLEMLKPFPATNQVTFELAPASAGTRVSWIMEGKCNFFLKAMSLFMSMDSMVGKDFSEGLANLDKIAR